MRHDKRRIVGQIKVRNGNTKTFYLTATKMYEIEVDGHGMLFTKKQVKTALDLLKYDIQAVYYSQVCTTVTPKCIGCKQAYSEVDVIKATGGRLKVGCSFISKKDADILRKWANKK